MNWEAAFGEGPIPNWQHERMQTASRFEAGFGNRHIGIPSESSHAGYHDMEALIFTTHKPRLQEWLESAGSGRGTFRYFKDVLLDYPAIWRAVSSSSEIDCIKGKSTD